MVKGKITELEVRGPQSIMTTNSLYDLEQVSCPSVYKNKRDSQRGIFELCALLP